MRMSKPASINKTKKIKKDLVEQTNNPFAALAYIMQEEPIFRFEKKLLENETNINVTNSAGDTLLHLAVKLRHLEAVKCLVKNNIEINKKNVFA